MGFLALTGLLLFSAVPVYEITCDPDQFQWMMENWEDEITIPCQVEIDGAVHENCTIRLRGDTSRIFRKKSYRIEFPEDDPFQGRTAWNFNADYLDHSYMRAWLFSRVLNDMGYPCFLTSHAELYVNGDCRGLFIRLEPVNEAFLARIGFDPSGNLYKAQYDGACASIHDDVDSMWAPKTGGTSSMNDLVELIQGVEYSPPDQFGAFMDSAFSMWGPTGLVRMLAVNTAFANNSTYYHNYYLFNDLSGTGRWHMFPWDVDKVLSTNLGISYGGCTNENWYDNPLHARTLTVPWFREAFIDSVQTIYQVWLTEEKVEFWADSLYDELHEAVGRDQYDNTDPDGFLQAMTELRQNLESRRTDLAWQFQYKYFPFRSNRSDTLTTGPLQISWHATEDPLGNQAEYTVILRDSLGPGAQELARYEGIADTTFTIQGFPAGSYWWTVETSRQAGWRRTEATDRYNPFRVVEPSILTGELGASTVLHGSGSPYYVPEEITVPAGGTLSIQSGVTVLFGSQGAINCLGDITVEGEPGDSVYLTAENSSSGWRGIRLQGGSVNMECAVVSGARGYAGSPGDDFAALAAHDGEVTLSGTVFRNNWCCVKLHGGTAQLYGCSFRDNRGELFFMEEGESALIENSQFIHLHDPVASSMDGIEFHNCMDGSFTVSGCTVSDIDGDCIDMNASTVLVTDTRISLSTDKGISVGAPTGGSGAGSLVTAENCLVEQCPTGVAVKDGAGFSGEGLVLTACGTGLHSYQKTQGMGGGIAWVSSSVFQSCSDDVLVEQGSVSVDWSISNSGSIPGQGNIAGDPLLDPEGYPLWNSPCIDSGDPSKSDPDGSRRDMGAYFFPTSFNGLCVNELMALNDTVIMDDWGRSSDWIEIFNGTGYDVDAGVLVFTEPDSSQTGDWSAPRGTMIPSGGFMLFWADGFPGRGTTHMPFRLSGAGDGFTLARFVPGETSAPTISVIETVEFGSQLPDLSIGRFPDGGDWTALEIPTPGYSNGTLYSLPVLLSQPRPNPCMEGSVEMDAVLTGGQTDVVIYDMAGRVVERVFSGYAPPGSSTFTWTPGGIPVGIYLVSVRCSGQTPASAKITVLR